MGFIKKIWNDPVWSKVISGIILAVLLSVAPALWNKIPFSNVIQYLTDPITVPLWAVIISPLLLILLALLLHRRKLWPFATNFKVGTPVSSIENTAKPIHPTRDEQKQILQTLKESHIETKEQVLESFDDPHEYRFYSIEKIRHMEGDERKKHLNRFLGGLWEVTIRKGSATNTYEYRVSTLSEDVLLRERPGMKQVFNIQIRQIQLNSKHLTLKWVCYSETEKKIVERETLRVVNDEIMNGRSESGFDVTYTRKNLSKAL